MEPRPETGVDREPEEIADILEDAASDIREGGFVKKWTRLESVNCEDVTEIVVAFKYTPTA